MFDKIMILTYFRDFTWSPSSNLVAYWVPEDKDTPARLVIMEMPSRQERRSKNLFNVASVSSQLQKSILKPDLAMILLVGGKWIAFLSALR